MVVAFTMTEINYLVVSLFCNVVLPFSICICGIKLIGCAICLVFGIVAKAAMPSPKSLTIFSQEPIKPIYFQTKYSLYISFFKLLGIRFYVDFFSEFF